MQSGKILKFNLKYNFSLFRTCLILRNLGFQAVAIHGQMSQVKRLGALNKFKAKEKNILIATDVASRYITNIHSNIYILKN